MERVTFLIDSTGERIGCMLNPEGFVLRRQAGVRALESVGGFVAGTALEDVPLLLTNGGSTELSLDLLFDVTLPGSSITSEDVRDFTRPLWNLSENNLDASADRPLPLCRFVWGKAWNIPGIIISVAEHLEYFTSTGIPRRSWLRLILRRVLDKSLQQTDPFDIPASTLFDIPPEGDASLSEIVQTGESTLRIDQLAQRVLGSDRLWRSLALQQGIDNPLSVT
ncbi:MAG: hypothetical protein HY080_02800 [Gammaproteobacteria bacterium]|nr:hypothetical protein [Gammaproteobacteria bacterium]